MKFEEKSTDPKVSSDNTIESSAFSCNSLFWFNTENRMQSMGWESGGRWGARKEKLQN